MHAIALCELSIVQILNAEAERAEAIAKQPVTTFTPDELIAFQHSVARILEMTLAQQELLFKKLRLILHSPD